MKRFSYMSCEVEGMRAVVCPTPAAAPTSRPRAQMVVARLAVSRQGAPAAGSFLASHAPKPNATARINADGWPPSPQDRSSG